MATSIAAPNIQRLALPEIDFTYDSNGIISIIDEVVERVMAVHMKKGLSLQASSSYSSLEDVFSFPMHIGHDFSVEQSKEAAA